MAYTKQTWIAQEGTGLNRYAKGEETSTHIELSLDPANLKNTPTLITMARLNHMEEGIAEERKVNVRVSLRHGNTFFDKTWAGLGSTPLYGHHIWTDGENIYYSYGASQYVLNKLTSTWVAKTWTGLTDFYGENIWTDGNNIYYNAGTKRFVLNKATNTWVTKTWTGTSGLGDFKGANIWTDGNTIYYSFGTAQYRLNKGLNLWEAKTWNGNNNFNGNRIWTNGENIYYSAGTAQFRLNKATSAWVFLVWAGLTDFTGNNIWTDGDNFYYSEYYNESTQQFVLKKPSTWVPKTWTGVTDFTGYDTWTDGNNIYSSTSTQYVVIPATRHNYVDDDKYNSLFGTVTKCICSTLSDRFVFGNE